MVKASARQFKDGYMALPSGPGLGIELDDDVVERYRIDRVIPVEQIAS